ncbi:hypothetical protein X771_29845 [Mesorhizobium sp. LSJC277A00]|nr:hypothetical protein X771_29845 [Mesorhizobium sp. LSJC277A00]
MTAVSAAGVRVNPGSTSFLSFGAQLDGAGARLLVALATLRVGGAQRVLLAIGGADGCAHLHFHSPFGKPTICADMLLNS